MSSNCRAQNYRWLLHTEHNGTSLVTISKLLMNNDELFMLHGNVWQSFAVIAVYLELTLIMSVWCIHVYPICSAGWHADEVFLWGCMWWTGRRGVGVHAREVELSQRDGAHSRVIDNWYSVMNVFRTGPEFWIWALKKSHFESCRLRLDLLKYASFGSLWG